MTHRIVRGLATCAAVGLVTLLSPRASLFAQPVTTLQSEQPVERRLDRGELHRYTIALSAGEYARVVVEQRHIDVIVQVRNAEDDVIEEFDDEIRTIGDEQVEMVAASATTFDVVVRPMPGSTAPGAYAIRIAERRAASDADRVMQESRTLRYRGY